MRNLTLAIATGLLLLLGGAAEAALVLSQDIGRPGDPDIAGSFVYDSGTEVYSVTAGGSDLWGTTDHGHFVYEELLGDGTITAQVLGFSGGTHDWRKAGVMIRDSLAAGSANVANIVGANNPNNDQRRMTTGAATVRTDPRPAGTGMGEAPWVRVNRSGDVFTFSYSPNGTDWFDYADTPTIEMLGSVYVGLAVTSHNNLETTTAQLTDVQLTDFQQVQTLTWDGLDAGDWDPGRWLPGGVPVNATHAVLPDTNLYTVTVREPASALSLRVDGGGLDISMDKSLTVGEAVNFATGTTLNMAAGATLSAGGGGVIRTNLNTTGSATVSNGRDLAVSALTVPAAATLTKQGTGWLTVSQDGVTAGAGSEFQIDGGTFYAIGANPLDQSTRVILNGGAFAFKGGNTPGSAPDPGLLAPVAHWQFNETAGSIAENSVIPGPDPNDGTLLGLPSDDSQWVSGKIGGALQFDGNGWVDAGAVDPVLDLTTSYSVTLWAKADSLTQSSVYQSVFSGGDNLDGSFQIDFDDADAGNYRWRGDDIVNIGAVDTDWVHLAVTFDGTNVATYYNGRLAAQGTHWGNNFVKYLIGRNRTGDWSYEGTLDDVYVYHAALTEQQVSDMYGTVTPPDLAGTTVVVTDNSALEARTDSATTVGTLELRQGILTTKGTAPITFTNAFIPTDTTGTVGLDPQVEPTFTAPINANGSNVTFAKGGPSSWTVDAFPVTNLGPTADWEVQDGTLDVTNGAAFEGRDVTVSGGRLIAHSLGGSDLTLAAGRFTFVQEIVPGDPGDIPADPVANWKFDETTGTTAADSSTLGDKPGTLNNFPGDDSQWVDGMIDGALQFDGSDDFVQIVGYKGIGGADPRTMAAWINTTDSDGSILAWGVDGVNGEKWTFRVEPSQGAIRVEVSGGSVVGTTEVRDGRWHHVAAVLPDGADNANQIELYVDGQLETLSDVTGEPIATNITDGIDVLIGSDHANRNLDGTLDDVYIYNRALSAGDIEGMSVVTVPDMSTTDVTVTGDSVLESASRSVVTFGTLTITDGGILRTTGKAGVAFRAPPAAKVSDTTIDPLAGAVGFDPQVATDLGEIDGSGAEVVVSKLGTSSMTLETPNIGLQDATFRVEEGTLTMLGTDSWGGSTKMELAGGTFEVAVPTDPGPGPEGAQFHFSFDETSGPVAEDSTPNERDGTLNGFPVDDSQWVPGKVNGALQFEGDDFVELVDYKGIEGSTPRTVAAWVKSDDNDGTIAAWGRTASGNGRRWTTRLNGGRFRTDFNGGYNRTDDTTIFTDDSVWHHVAAVLPEGEDTYGSVLLYVDGVLVPSTSDAPGLIINTDTTNAASPPVRVGVNDRMGEWFAGQIDELYLYGRALDADEIARMFGSSDLADYSTHSVRVTGDATLKVSGVLSAVFGPLTMADGSLLTTTGTLNGIRFDGGAKAPDTTIDPGASAVGFDPQTPTGLGVIDGSLAGAAITKYGAGTLVLNHENVNLSGSTFEAQAGQLNVVPADTGGGKVDANPLEQAGLLLTGGETVLSGRQTGDNPVYDNPVEVRSDGVSSTLTAGPGAAGAPGPVSVTLGSAAKASPMTLTSGTVVLQALDDYSLTVAGNVAGEGSLRAPAGPVTLDAGVDVGSLRVEGGDLATTNGATIADMQMVAGTLTSGADLNVADGAVTGGSFTLNNNSSIVVSNSLTIDTTPYRIDTGTFKANGSDLLSSADLTVSGGRLTVGNDPLGSLDILFVVGNPNLTSGGDQGVYDRLTADLGHTVTAIDDNGSDPNQAAGKDLVIISSTVGPANVDTKFTDMDPAFGPMGIPTLIWEQNLVEEFHFSDNGNRRGGGNADTLTIFNPSHPLAAGLSGNVLVRDTTGYFRNIDAREEKSPSPDLIRVAHRVEDDADRVTIGAIDGGDRLNNDVIASARRVFFGMDDDGLDDYTADVGLPLFDAAVNYAAGADLAAQPVDQDTTHVFVNADVSPTSEIASASGREVRLGNLTIAEGVTELTLANAPFSFADLTTPAATTVVGEWSLRSNLNLGDSAKGGIGTLTFDTGDPTEKWVEFGSAAEVNMDIGLTNDAIVMTKGVLSLGNSALNLNVVGDILPAAAKRSYGAKTVNIVSTTENSEIDDVFNTALLPGDHLDRGIFVDVEGNGVVTTTISVKVDLYQAQKGDANGDHVIDTGDMMLVFGNWTVPPPPEPEPRDWPEGNFSFFPPEDANTTIETGDMMEVFGNWTLEDAGDAKDGDPQIADLLYYPATGEVELDPSEAAGEVITIFRLMNDPGDPDFNAPGVANFPWPLPDFLAVDTPLEIANTDLSGSGISDVWSLGAIFPTGLDQDQLEAFLTVATYVGSRGTGVHSLDLIVIPEPGTVVMLLTGALGLLLLALRRRTA